MKITDEIVSSIESRIDNAGHLNPHEKRELKSHILGHATIILSEKKYEHAGQLVDHFGFDILPGGALFREVFERRAHKLQSLYYADNDRNENRYYNEDKDEPLSAGKPTVEDARINIGCRFDQSIIESSIAKVLNDLPDNINDELLRKILNDLGLTRLDNPVTDPFHLIRLTITPYWDNETGQWEIVYNSLTDLLRKNRHLSEKKVRASRKKIEAELKRWVNQQYEKLSTDKINRI